MVSIHLMFELNDFVYQQYGVQNGNLSLLESAIKSKYGSSLKDFVYDESSNQIFLSIESPNVQVDERFDEFVNLCNKGKLHEALKLGLSLLKDYPNDSEMNRMVGQLYSDIDNPDLALDYLLESLKLDPSNKWSLIMMGNIFMKDKNDSSTALQYYNQALIVDPEDNLIINNIGANFLQSGDYIEAIDFFNLSIESNKEFCNPYLGLSKAYMGLSDLKNAFKNALIALKKAKDDKVVSNEAQDLLIHSAKMLSKDDLNSITQIVDNFKDEYNRDIRFQEDDTIQTLAKIEFSENYQRNYDLILYKSNGEGISHIILHELIHFKFFQEARKVNKNKLFITMSVHYEQFKNRYAKSQKKLLKKGYSSETVHTIFKNFHSGLNSQIFNTPIDLFIEDYIYSEYKEFRPDQLISLLNILSLGIKAVTDKDVIYMTPKSILSASKIYNLIGALQLKDLYGINLIKQFEASSIEIKQAEQFYKEFQEYRFDRSPSEEYELVQLWAEDLKLDNYFELVDEVQFRNKNYDKFSDDKVSDDVKDIINKAIDSYDIYTDSEQELMDVFQEEQGKDFNPAIMMFMVGALEFLTLKSEEELKTIANEVALVGMSGINPEKSGYTLRSIPDKSFSGYQLLAYFYVSWALAFPNAVHKLELPYHKEFETANKIYNG